MEKVTRIVVFIMVIASLMGCQGAAIDSPNEEQLEDRRFPGLPYGMLPHSQNYLAVSPAASAAPMGSYAAPPAPASYAHSPIQVIYQSAPATYYIRYNIPHPASYQAGPQSSLPYYAAQTTTLAPTPYQPAMAAPVYPSMSAPAAPNSYNSYSATPSTAVPSYQYPTTKAPPYAASPSAPASYAPARPSIQANYQAAPQPTVPSAPYAALDTTHAPAQYQPAMSAPTYPVSATVAAASNSYNNYSPSSTASY